MFKQHDNMTMVERIHSYVQQDQRDKALALAKLGDYLEECWQWEVDFGGPGPLTRFH
jgi:hypothetical protein